MESWEIVLLTAGCSLVASIVTAIITSLIHYRQDSKKWIRDKRAEVYPEIYAIVEETLNDRAKVFEREYFERLIQIKSKVKLLSSETTFEAFKEYYGFIRSINYDFKKFNKENDPVQVITECTPNGEEFEEPYASDLELAIFEKKIKQYQKDNRPDSDTMNSYIEPLYQSMRNDLGSDL